MRIVTWNMGRSRNTHEAAWHYVLSCLRPDVACVQEALVSTDQIVADRGTVTWSRARPGGTGVFVRRGLDFRPIPSTLFGSYVAAVALSAPPYASSALTSVRRVGRIKRRSSRGLSVRSMLSRRWWVATSTQVERTRRSTQRSSTASWPLEFMIATGVGRVEKRRHSGAGSQQRPRTRTTTFSPANHLLKR